MSKLKAGDTLIEVLFAFVILASITGFAFTGALQSYRVSVDAQNRTQATLYAQYQADGLITYRNSLDWTATQPGFPAFLDGGGPNSLPAITPGMKFCMDTQAASPATNPKVWKLQIDLDTCNNNGKATMPNLRDVKVEIEIINPGRAATIGDKVQAKITVSWLPVNSSARGQVVDNITLTKEK